MFAHEKSKIHMHLEALNFDFLRIYALRRLKFTQIKNSEPLKLEKRHFLSFWILQF